jgi:hypothetical protein
MNAPLIPRSHPLRLIVLATVAVAVVGGMLYLALGPNVDVYVDNGSAEPIAVFLDGAEKVVVSAGAVKSFSCTSGSHRFVARRGDTVVFDETKTVESRGKAGRGKYLLNPEATNRYRTLEVQYGMSIPTFGTYRDDEHKCRLHVEALGLIPAAPWIDVHPDYVLEKPPAEVEGNLLASRTVVARVPRVDADVISAMLAHWEQLRPVLTDNLEADISERIRREDEVRREKQNQIAAVEAAIERIKKATEN